MIAWLAVAAALAQDGETEGPGWPEVALHGDVKAFVTATVPYDHPLMPPEASVRGIGDGRLKLTASMGRWTFDAHHEISLIEQDAAGLGISTGVARTAPEAVDLTWEAEDGELLVRGRTDRLWLRGRFGLVDATVGRQPISFGTGTIFTPLDLVAPFHPATIDQEYKPGVDAVRVDGFFGTSGQITAVGAYGGDWSPEGVVLAAYGQATVGVTDVGLFVGDVYAEPVVGVSVGTSVGPVGVHGDATVTLPEGEDPFARAVVGAFVVPRSGTSITAELYLQTFGADEPSEYLVVAQQERFARGEVWQMGRYYAALAGTQEITPLLTVSAAAIANLADPSVLVAPSLVWSVAENAEVSGGAWIGLGERPGEAVPPADPTDVDAALRGLGVESEFGLYPASLFLRMATYF